MNVLIVDDQRTSLTLLGKIVELMGGVPFKFADPVEALQASVSTPFDLALVDVNMPAMDGLSFVRLLRSLPECSSVPALMVTVDDSAWVRESAAEAGASGVVAKPIDRLELTEHCLKLIRSKGH